MKTLLLLISFITLINSSNSYAAGSLAFNKINQIAFQTGGFFMYAPNWPNPNNCTRSNAVVLLSSDPNYDKAYALLLSAYMAGKLVKGYSNGCTTFDGQTYNTYGAISTLRYDDIDRRTLHKY